MPRCEAYILGGLPVIADVNFGRDTSGPDWTGEAWAEVDAIYWRKKDGSAGKPIPLKVWERAEAYDCGFCDLTQYVSECLAHDQWEGILQERA